MRVGRSRIAALVAATAALVAGWAPPASAEEPRPDLAITSTVSPSPAWVGEPVTLGFTVVNNGDAVGTVPVLSTVLNSPFDIGFRFVSASPGCEYSEELTPRWTQHLVTCTLPDLPPGGSAQVSIVVAYDELGSRACGAYAFAQEELSGLIEPDPTGDNLTECTVQTQEPLLDLPLGLLRVRLAIAPALRLTLV